MLIYLVSCVGQKESHRCQARDLYVSTWFVKARKYVEGSHRPWFILSAMHGLVSPDRRIYPYERTLNTMSVAERRAWAESVDRQLSETVRGLSEVVFLAGKRYREFLVQHLADRGISASVPMEGMGIGEQLSWLTRNAPAEPARLLRLT